MSKQAQVMQEQKNWVSQVNTGLQMKRAGEEMVAKALRARLDQVGEKAWLRQCEDEWGWGRSAAYAHLNPEQLEKNRVRQRPQPVDAAPRQPEVDPVEEWETDGDPVPQGPRLKDTIDPLFHALGEVAAAMRARPVASVVEELRQQHTKGNGFDAQLQRELESMRDWLDMLIRGLQPLIVSCDTGGQ